MTASISYAVDKVRIARSVCRRRRAPVTAADSVIVLL